MSVKAKCKRDVLGRILNAKVIIPHTCNIGNQYNKI